jgi:hypothetical protein
LLELIDTLDKMNRQQFLPELSTKQSAESEPIQVNPKRAVLQHLDQLPMPAWDLVDMNAYKVIWATSGQNLHSISPPHAVARTNATGAPNPFTATATTHILPNILRGILNSYEPLMV